MPVLELRGLPQREGVDVQAALKKTSAAIAEVYGCAPRQVWATWTVLKPEHYVEGDTAAPQVQPEDSFPPLGRLICFEGRSDADIECILLAASETLSDALGIPGNVFITYDEAQSGRVVDGNGVVRK